MKMSRKKRFVVGVLLPVMLLLVAFLVFRKNEQVFEMESTQLKKDTITETIRVSGFVSAAREVVISPDVSGEITELLVEEGDFVKKDQHLLSLQNDIYLTSLYRAQAQFKQAKASLLIAEANLLSAQARTKQAENTFKRQQGPLRAATHIRSRLRKSRHGLQNPATKLGVCPKELNSRTYSIESSQTSVEEAEKNLLRTKIYAPMSGIITKLSVGKGERMVGTRQMEGTKMITIADLDSMEVSVAVNEMDILEVKLGNPAEVSVESYERKNIVFHGEVSSIAYSPSNVGKDGEMNTETITEFSVKIHVLPSSYENHPKLKDIKHPIRPGMTANVKIITRTKKDAWTLPISAVVGKATPDRKTMEVIYVYEDGVARQHKVQTGLSDLEKIEIASTNIKPKDLILSGPYLLLTQSLYDGAKVSLARSKDKKPKKRRRRYR